MVLSFNGVGQFEIQNGKYYIPYDEIYGWECMQETNYDTFITELEKRRHIWYDSWDYRCALDYDNFYAYAKNTQKKTSKR